MSVTVEDLMRLPSLRQAKVIGGSGGMRRVVSSISVLESTKPEILVNELFPDARSGYSGGELVITGFINCTDDVEMQCENVRRLIEGGEDAAMRSLAPLTALKSDSESGDLLETV